MIQKLNAEQKQLVADNHNLIYGYAHKKKLDLDEYYDILALGLCRAALSFDSNKSSFQTYAYMIMGSEVNAHRRFKVQSKRTLDKSVKEVRLDDPVDYEDNDKDTYSTIGEFKINPNVPL
jgi:DNA-directed RNA polymerase specialized sigma subunit